MGPVLEFHTFHVWKCDAELGEVFADEVDECGAGVEWEVEYYD